MKIWEWSVLVEAMLLVSLILSGLLGFSLVFIGVVAKLVDGHAGDHFCLCISICRSCIHCFLYYVLEPVREAVAKAGVVAVMLFDIFDISVLSSLVSCKLSDVSGMCVFSSAVWSCVSDVSKIYFLFSVVSSSLFIRFVDFLCLQCFCCFRLWTISLP